MKPGWETKIWGWTRCNVEGEFYSQHELEAIAGSFCSFHYHENRANRFLVTKGIIRVVWCYGWQIHHRDLTAENFIDIPSLVPHQFQVLADSLLWEQYHPDRGGKVSNSDIVRLTQGGRTEVERIVDSPGVLKSNGELWYP